MKSRFVRRAIELGAVRSGFRLLERLDSRSRSTLRVLTYHLIEDAEGFRAQVEHLARNYQPVGQAAVAAAPSRGRPCPRAVLVTFDDADRNFGEVAWPILREAGVPALLFVPTAYPDHRERRFWWDELIHAVRETDADEAVVDGQRFSLRNEVERRAAIRGLKQRVQQLEPAEIEPWIEVLRERLAVGASNGRVLGWEALRQLAAAGVEIGAHTRTHPFLDRLAPEALRDEIAGSVQDLEENLGTTPIAFAYPNGRTSPAVVEAVAEAGLSLAFTTLRGAVDTRQADRFQLRRINMGPAVGAGVLQARLLQSSPRFGRVTVQPSRR